MNLFVSIPHSGEKVPDECRWLQGLPEPLLMGDVDRYVDRLYEPALKELQIPWVKTEWHRYAADLNRIPEDIDSGSVQGNSQSAGVFRRGFHWQVTTKGQRLMKEPMSLELHQKLVKLIYEPFHESLRHQYMKSQNSYLNPVYHLDLHSMPSVGTSEHRDPGEKRAEIVVSDCLGQSSCQEFVNIVIVAYVRAGFKVGYNWPYIGGRVSEQYGQPDKGRNVVQVELNRALYMDEESKRLLEGEGGKRQMDLIQEKLKKALSYILDAVKIV